MTGIIASGVLSSDDALAAAWNDPGVNLVQNSAGQWIDSNTGQYVSTQGMPSNTHATNNTSTPTPAVAPAPTQNTTPTSNQGPTPNVNNNTTNTNAPKTTKAGWGAMSGKQRAVSVAGAAIGAAGVYASATGQGEHGAMDVAGGVASGTMMGASIGSIFPVIGTTIGAISGAVIGGVISGSQLFSETDCLHDPITGQFTCCNTVFNQGERQVPIGGYMFCGNNDNQAMLFGVRQCLQGGQDKEAGWWAGLWKDDEWSKECTVRLCPGEVEIANGTPAESIEPIPDTNQICWNWGCKVGYIKTGGTCVPDKTVPSVSTYDALIKKIQHQIQQLQQECGGIM